MQLPTQADAWSLAELWRNVAPLAFMATCGFAWRVSGKLVRIETILTGATGENGLNGEVKKLRERTHEIADQAQAVLTKVEVLEAKLGE